jgi:ApaG protein
MPPPSKNPGSVSLTRGIRVAVAPSFDADQSDPALSRFIFSYRIRITNESQRRAKLLSRHWIIVDADGHRHEVQGEGVVGQQPDLAPGQAFTYASFCPLQTAWGTMEGTYTMLAEDGESFEVQIGRFFLTLPHDEPAGS